MRDRPTSDPPPGLVGSYGIHHRFRYRRIFRISLGVSALLHLVAIALYPSFSQGIPEWTPLPGGGGAPVSPQGTELVNLREIPADDEIEAVLPEEEREIEVPAVPVPVRSQGVPGAPGSETKADEARPLSAAEALRVKAGDLRLWAPVDPELSRLTDEEIMRLRLAAEIELMNDSAAIAAERARRATDWTYTDEEGKKWGVSPGKIHLGDLTLPMPFGFGTKSEDARNRVWEWEAIERGAASGDVLRSWKERDKAIRERLNAQRRPDTTGVGG